MKDTTIARAQSDITIADLFAQFFGSLLEVLSPDRKYLALAALKRREAPAFGRSF